jgi:hypothetical protein
VASIDKLTGEARLRATLASIAPGTELREGLERILRGRTGALLVLGQDKVVESISTGGFELDVPFTPTGLRELAKMDGAIILDRDATKLMRAGVHLMPDPSIPTDEAGTRHRTADRVARQTNLPVISVSQSMLIIAIYVGDSRYTLEDSGQILSRANQALATLERYKLRLDEVSGTLSALEIEDLVTVRDVAAVAQRLEMVLRIAREIEGYVVELGTDGRRGAGGPEGAGLLGACRHRLGRPSPLARRTGAPRQRDHAARLPAAGKGSASARHGRRPAGRALRQPAEAARRQHRRPADRRRGRRVPRPQRPRGPVPAGRVQHPRTLRLSFPSAR